MANETTTVQQTTTEQIEAPKAVDTQPVQPEQPVTPPPTPSPTPPPTPYPLPTPATQAPGAAPLPTAKEKPQPLPQDQLPGLARELNVPQEDAFALNSFISDSVGKSITGADAMRKKDDPNFKVFNDTLNAGGRLEVALANLKQDWANKGFKLEPEAPVAVQKETIEIKEPITTPQQQQEATDAQNIYDITRGKIEQANADIDSELNNINGMLDSRITMLDANLQQRLDLIKKQYAQRRTDMQKVNTNNLNGLKIMGIRAGRQRYAPEIQSGILGAEERAGIERISALDAEEQRLLQEAEMANNEQQWAILDKKIGAAKDARQEKAAAIDRLYKIGVDEENMLFEKKKYQDDYMFKLQDLQFRDEQAARQEEQDTQGYIDKQYSMFGSKAFEGLPPTALAEMEAKAGIPAGTLLRQQETLKEIEKLQKEQIIKVGAGETLFDPNTGEAIFMAPQKAEKPQIFGSAQTGYFTMDPNTGKTSQLVAPAPGGSIENISQSDRMRMAEALKQDALSKGQILSTQDALNQADRMFAGENISGMGAQPKTDQEKALRDMLGSISGSLTSAQRPAVVADINNKLANGDYQGAANTLLNTIVESSPAKTQDEIMGRVTAIDSLNSIKSDLNTYISNGGNTGVFSGTEEQMLRNIGKTKDPQLAALQNKIAVSIITYRRAVSGAAFTESESKVYDSLFPSIGNIPKLNNALIDSLVNTFESNQESFFKTKLGPNNYQMIQNIQSGSTPQLIEQQDNYEISGIIQEARSEKISDAHILNMLKQSGYNVPANINPYNAKTYIDSLLKNKMSDASSVIQSSYPKGATGGQCGTFAHKIANFPSVGDSKQAKIASVQKYGVTTDKWNPKPGDVIITNENKIYGHVAVVNKILSNGQVQLSESNYYQKSLGPEKVSHNRIIAINSPKIYGAIPATLKV